MATKHIPVAKLRNGQIARIEGTLQLAKGQSVTSPFGRRCAHYHLMVFDPRRYHLLEEWDAIAFSVDDGTGVAEVTESDPEVERTVTPDGAGWFHSAVEAEAIRKSSAHEDDAWLMRPDLRYEERALEPGDRVAVVGMVRIEGSGDGERVLLEAPRKGRLRVRKLAP